MHVQRTLVASAVLSAITSISFAQTADKPIATVIVTATPFNTAEGDQILSPAKVLSGDELRNKLGSSLGETLSHELGVSASAFGAGASRPIIRGLEGARIKVLENGMSVSDISGLSNDHAVATDGPTARQIEILRGPAALLYGSGAIGGLVNIVNERIPTTLEAHPIGQIEARYSTADRGNNVSFSTDGARGPIALHIDGSVKNAEDYKIPDGRFTNQTDGASSLPWSYSRQHSVGAGAAYVGSWGYLGASVSSLTNRYGIPTAEGSQIDQSQRRYDIDSLVRQPLPGFETFRFKAGYTDYAHTELDLENVPQTEFSNRALETRWDLTHKTIAGWHGTFGMQTENTNFAALNAGTGAPNTVPATLSTSRAVFLVEERELGPLRLNAGVRFESTERKPATGRERNFNLTSYSIGGLWPLKPGYSVGVTASVAQRAPAADELYSGGPHDSTATFDIGDPNFGKETSRNIELSLQKTSGLLRWKANLFENRVKDFVYGEIAGRTVDDEGNSGDELRERIFRQGDAAIRGAEAEISYNLNHEGWSTRAFADSSHGALDKVGSLPLQPATRFGVELGFRRAAVRGGVSMLRALRQDRLASFETAPTGAYTQVDANLSYTQKMGAVDVTWFMVAKNLLNQDIRLSTSVLKDVAPLPGRNLIVGVRTKF
jgi:iron complex outermembrane receptor protein